MSAYLLCIREGKVKDAAELAKYSQLNHEAPKNPKLKPLIVYGATEARGHDYLGQYWRDAPGGTLSSRQWPLAEPHDLGGRRAPNLVTDLSRTAD